MWRCPDNVIEIPALRNRTNVFVDRADAGEQLSTLLSNWRGSDAIVIAIPAGGMPVADVIARQLDLPFDVLVVSKMTLPWNPEAGYGAMAADGILRVNEALISATGMDRDTVDAGIERTRKKVKKRELYYHRHIEAQPLADRSVIIVDDGLASGFTLRVAIDSAQARGATKVIVTVPTGPSTSIDALARDCDRIYCANIREGVRFAVADAYQRWRDVSEEEVLKLLKEANKRQVEDLRS